jgi:hypothetical protein
MKREDAPRNGSGRISEDESKRGAGAYRMKCLFVQSNEGKTSLKCVRRGWLNYPPYPMAVPTVEMAQLPIPAEVWDEFEALFRS